MHNMVVCPAHQYDWPALSGSLRSMAAATPLVGWVNGELYEQTSEQFGILAVPSQVQASIG